MNSRNDIPSIIRSKEVHETNDGTIDSLKYQAGKHYVRKYEEMVTDCHSTHREAAHAAFVYAVTTYVHLLEGYAQGLSETVDKQDKVIDRLSSTLYPKF